MQGAFDPLIQEATAAKQKAERAEALLTFMRGQFENLADAKQAVDYVSELLADYESES